LRSCPGPITGLQALVVTSSGEPVPNAIVEHSSENPIEKGQIAVTGAKGSVRFPNAPQGALRLVARADRFVTAGTRISDDSRDGIVLRLSRGHRVVVAVEWSAETGPYRPRNLPRRPAQP
jgi:hypothetical protein